MERALLDRSRVICKLQWELLNRDISIIKLQTELESIKCEQNKLPLTEQAAIRRYRFGQKRSESEKLHLKKILRNEEENDNQEALYSLLNVKDWPQRVSSKSELSKITHELKMKLFKLSQQCDQREEGSEWTDASQPLTANNVSKNKYDFSHPLFLKILHSFHFQVKEFQDLINVKPKLHQNNSNHSRNNISNGLEGFANSSFYECDKSWCKSRNCWRQSRKASPSSESSFLEEQHLTSSHWANDYGDLKLKSSDFGLNDNKSNNLTSQYICDSRFSPDILNRQENDSLRELYNNKIYLKQYSSSSSSSSFSPSFSVSNKGLQDFSSLSGHQLASTTNPTSLNQSSFKSFSSLQHDKYAGIPMIDEDQLEITSSNPKTCSGINNHRLLVYMNSRAKPWTAEKTKEDYNNMKDTCNNIATKDVKLPTKETFQKPF